MEGGLSADLGRLLEACGARVLLAANYQEARGVLGDHPRVDLVLTASRLEDGYWWMIRNELLLAECEAALVVCTHGGADVTDLLDVGCTAVLVAPFQKWRICELLGAAMDGARNRSGRNGQPTASPGETIKCDGNGSPPRK